MNLLTTSSSVPHNKFENILKMHCLKKMLLTPLGSQEVQKPNQKKNPFDDSALSPSVSTRRDGELWSASQRAGEPESWSAREGGAQKSGAHKGGAQKRALRILGPSRVGAQIFALFLSPGVFWWFCVGCLKDTPKRVSWASRVIVRTLSLIFLVDLWFCF